MISITKISFTNYRAFFNDVDKEDEYVIELPKGQNLLVYGENGSGKSSLFKGIKEFLYSADESINITENIFTTGSLELPPAEIKISFAEKDIDNTWKLKEELIWNKDGATTTGNVFLNESNKAFLSYKEILYTYFLDGENPSNNPNLFNLFVEILLSKVSDSSTGETFSDNLRDLEESIATFEKAVKQTMSEPDSEEPEKSLGETKGEEQIREDLKEGILDEIRMYNDSIRITINEIIDDVNNYLNKFFKNNIEISLEENYEFVSLIDSENQLDKKLVFNYKYFGNNVNDYAYSVFLNEARLSALAICIYLAAIKQNDYPDFKILFLDDIFIGLDNSNRKPLIDILLKDFTEFQIFITTYDRYWYEMAKAYARDWKNIEMFVGYNEKYKIEHPVIFSENLDVFSKALKYFESHDYYSAGNNLRKALEKHIERLVPKTYLITENELDGYFNQLIKYYKDCSCDDFIDDKLEQDLYIFKDILLNPASHNDLKSPVYKSEVQRAIEIVKKVYSLPIINRVPILLMGDFLFYYNYEKDYTAQYFIVEDIYSIEIVGHSPRITIPKHKLLTYSFRKKAFVDRNGKKYKDSKIQSLKADVSKLTERVDRIRHFLSLTTAPDWKKDFKTASGFNLTSIQERLIASQS